nr:MAG TPA: hypothetical protein [Caudoviricetes sp.]
MLFLLNYYVSSRLLFIFLVVKLLLLAYYNYISLNQCPHIKGRISYNPYCSFQAF